MHKSEAIWKVMERERMSTDPSISSRYNEAMFPSTISDIQASLGRSSPSSISGGRPFRTTRLRSLQLDPGVAQLNSLRDNLILSCPDSIAEYACHGLSISSEDGYCPDDISYLTSFIHNIATNVRSNNPQVFDVTRPCAVCGQSGHTFDNCPQLQNKEALTKAYIRIVSALNRLLKSVRGSQNKDINTLAAHGLKTVAAVDSIVNAPSSSNESSIVQALAHSAIATNDHLKNVDSKIDGLINVICDHSSSTPHQPTDTDSASTSDTTTADPINALRDFVSTGCRSDFWFGRS